MTITLYSAVQASADRVLDFNKNQETAFNLIMEKIKVAVSLEQDTLEVLEVKAFEYFNLETLFVEQGYDVVPVGMQPTLKYIICWE